MSKFDDSGTAFPTEYNDRGLTMRDYFAAAALQGLLAKYGNAEEERSCQTVVQASTCYEYADSMIVARKGIE